MSSTKPNLIYPAPIDVLPHRPPFLFLDEVTTCEDRDVIGGYTFPSEAPFFQGHFPGYPIVPGVLLLEGMAQTLAYWALRHHPDHLVLLTGVEQAKFSRAVQPDERLRYTLKVKRARLGLVIAEGLAEIEGEGVARGVIKGFLKEKISAK